MKDSPKGTRAWLILAALFVVTSILLNTTNVYRVAARSMMPFLFVGTHVLVGKSLDFPVPLHVNDVVLFRVPDKIGELGLKRIVAVPGDSISIVRNVLRVSGATAQYHLSSEFFPDVGPDVGAIGQGVIEQLPGRSTMLVSQNNEFPVDYPRRTIPINTYFVLGDNRTNSDDSRIFGPLKRSRILGKLLLRL